MSRLDDDLRRVTAQLADEPLPSGILDEALDRDAAAPRWASLAAAIAAVVVLGVGVSIGVGQLDLAPEPSPTLSVAPSDQPAPTHSPMVACEDVAQPAGGADIVRVFFPCPTQGGEGMASGVRSVSTDALLTSRIESALVALLDGPDELERGAGMVEIIPGGSGELIIGLTVAPDGLLLVDFALEILAVSNLSASAASAAFLGAIEATAFQFPEVTAVELRVEGDCDAFFTHLQAACQHIARAIVPTSDCPVIAPAELPSGVAITAPRPFPGQPMVSWGSGTDTVTQLAGHRDSGGDTPPDGEPVTVRGFEGYLIPIGDVPDSQVEFGWFEDGCPYRVWIRLDDGIEAARDFAQRYGPPAVAQPSSAPAAPITASTEELGIRLTVELDRDRTAFGERLFATATIENLGHGSVFWGHSGTCAFPASISATLNDPTPLPYGRDDWPGDAGVLKDTTVYEVQDGHRASVYGFAPEGWLDFDGLMGCTSDLQISELPEGETLNHRIAWDTEGVYGMAPDPGTYTVDGFFAFMSRGAAPTFEEENDEFSVSVTLPLIVDAPERPRVSPGEAVDALLDDATYRSHLDATPRREWSGSEIAWKDGDWEVVLYLGREAEWNDPVDTLVGLVDADTGNVVSAGFEQRLRPGGG